MAVKKGKDLGICWECNQCSKWNFAEAKICWKCHEPKYPSPPPKKRGRPKKETVDANS